MSSAYLAKLKSPSREFWRDRFALGFAALGTGLGFLIVGFFPIVRDRFALCFAAFYAGSRRLMCRVDPTVYVRRRGLGRGSGCKIGRGIWCGGCAAAALAAACQAALQQYHRQRDCQQPCESARVVGVFHRVSLLKIYMCGFDRAATV